ncbi:MAG: helix-turn-helix transcriptional regulator [Armatimonadetes bacterium]|nr:helix-turn-helix transcriptional regulator [Armatimonadota bacterium]
MSDPRELGTRLYDLRTRWGLSASQAAHRVGCSVSSIFNWEAGVEMPPARFLRRLAETYRVTVEELLGG